MWCSTWSTSIPPNGPQFADRHSWPFSFVYRREGVKLLAVERGAAAQAAATVLVTRGEAELFQRLAPECNGRVHVIENGVDVDYFAPHDDFPSPFGAGEEPIVFTGAMDYWPNIDAVSWFAREVLPRVAQQRSDARFYIVGLDPAPTVRALATNPRVIVTGTVPDVRPYLQHAAVVVAPLRVGARHSKQDSRSNGDGETGGGVVGGGERGHGPAGCRLRDCCECRRVLPQNRGGNPRGSRPTDGTTRACQDHRRLLLGA